MLEKKVRLLLASFLSKMMLTSATMLLKIDTPILLMLVLSIPLRLLEELSSILPP